MRTVLLTGVTGFVGRACLEPLLRLGFTVHGVARRAGRFDAPFTKHEADLLDPAQVSALIREVRPSYLLHLAWIATPGVYWTSAENTRWLESSRHLLMEFQKQGGTRAVVAGTCAEYDWSEGVCREGSTPLRSASIYGESKNALREALAATGLNHAWARLFFPYGPHEPVGRLVPSVIRSLQDGLVPECSPGTHARDFIHVSDVGAALSLLLTANIQGAINIGSGEAVPIRQIGERLLELIPGKIAWGARPQPKEPPLVVADVTRLRRELGFQPRFDWRTGLADAAVWWQPRLARAA